MHHPPIIWSHINPTVHHQGLLALIIQRHVLKARNGGFQGFLPVWRVHYEDAEQVSSKLIQSILHNHMRSFREFLTEAGPARPFRPQVSAISGRLDLPDLSAASRLAQTPPGGYDTFGHMWGDIGQKIQYNARYPIKTHGATNFPVSYSYEQMRRALTQLSSVVQGIYGVIASKGTEPTEEHMSPYVRYAHFQGQKLSWNDPFGHENVNKNYIHCVDIKAYIGRITGGTGMQAFMVGEAFNILLPTSKQYIQQVQQNFKEPIQDDSMMDIDIEMLRKHMYIFLDNLEKFEGNLMSGGFLAQKADQLMGIMGKGHLGTTLGTNPMATAAMRKS
jgi:hypothetical protein